jgi:hypothetical protein
MTQIQTCSITSGKTNLVCSRSCGCKIMSSHALILSYCKAVPPFHLHYTINTVFHTSSFHTFCPNFWKLCTHSHSMIQFAPLKTCLLHTTVAANRHKSLWSKQTYKMCFSVSFSSLMLSTSNGCFIFSSCVLFYGTVNTRLYNAKWWNDWQIKKNLQRSSHGVTCLVGLRKSMKTLSQDSWSPRWKSNYAYLYVLHLNHLLHLTISAPAQILTATIT